MSCCHLVSGERGQRDGGEQKRLAPCWEVVWVVRVRVAELTRPHDDDVGLCAAWGSRVNGCEV